MKKIQRLIKFNVTTLLLSIFFVNGVFSQWQADFRLTNNTGGSLTSYYNSRCLTANGDFIHIVWSDDRDGNSEIYYKNSVDAGLTWGADTRLTNNSENSYNPSIITSGTNVMVVWNDMRDGNDEIYFKRSNNQGISWGADTRLSNNSSYSQNPSISVSGQIVCVFWGDGRENNGEVFYKRSTDGGMNWGSEINLSNNVIEIGSWNPAVCVSGSTLHVSWHCSYYGVYDIFYKRSTNNGVSWSANERLSNNPAESYDPSIFSSGQFVHVTWFDKRDGYYQIYYKRSTDEGNNWSTDLRLTNAYPESLNPNISSSGNMVHITWFDDRDFNREIYYKRSTDNGATWGVDTRLTNSSGISSYPFIAASGSFVNVIWTDDRNGNSEIYYKRNPIGNLTAITTISSVLPLYFSLSQNYPNPFNPSTNIGFRIAEFGLIRIVVYDALGREVQTLVNQELSPGTYEIDFNGSDLPSGVYYYKLESGAFNETKSMVLIK